MGGPRLLKVLETGGRALRRAGLGRLVDVLGGRIVSSFGDFRAEVDGLVLVGRGAAQMHYVEELRHGGRERAFVERLVAALAPGSTVVEGGAHLGYVTLQAARAVGPAGRLVTFEPDSRVIPLLCESLVANGLEGVVTVDPRALGAAAGRADLYLTQGGDTSSLVERPPTRPR
jgi:hypothetical protein